MKKKLVVILGSIFLAFVSVFVPVSTRGVFNRAQKADAFATNDTSFVRVNELWRDGAFIQNNLNKLLQYVSGDEEANVNNMKNVAAIAKSKRTSYQMRSTAVLDKTTSQDIVVTLGGLDWTPTYLFTEDNNIILTLWLSNSEQLSGMKYADTTFNANGQARWMNFSPSGGASNDPAYPDNMYGISYMRSVVLNNGGLYSTAHDMSTSATFEQINDGVFSPFTIQTEDNSAIADFIVAPSEVSWQERGNSIKIYWGYYYPNESWAKDISNEGFSNSQYGFYAHKEYSDAWKDDLLWLPSFSEVGYNGESGNNSGVWETSSYQRNTINSSNYAWTRSAIYDDRYRVLMTSYSNQAYLTTGGTYAVRPAIHLNLTKAAGSEYSAADICLDELWDSENNTVNSSSLNSIYSYLAGKENATYEDVLKLAKETKDSKYINGMEFNDKKSTQDLLITLNGLVWSPTYLSTDKNGNAILTLWLNDSSQLNGKRYGENANFNALGSAQWCTYSTSTSTSTPYPDNMYGTSYMRSVVLNNGGFYSTSRYAGNAVNYEPNANSAFALLTMQGSREKSLTDYLVTPRYVDWQESGQSAKTQLNVSYNLANENWSKDTSDTDFYNYYYNFAKRNNSDIWKDDYLWLPSLTELGGSTTQVGIWNTSVYQRSNVVQSWTRTGYESSGYTYIINQNGNGFTYSTKGNGYYGIRPALHFNLNIEGVDNGEQANEKDETSYVVVDELWDAENGKMNSDNFTTLMKYISGNANVKYGEIINMARNEKTARDFRNTNVSGKAPDKDVVLTLGGLEWTATYLSTDKYGNAILTLWLNDSKQLSGGKYGSNTFNEFGQATFNSGFKANDIVDSSYPDNMYGTSYMSSVVLNNGGEYSNLSATGVWGVTQNLTNSQRSLDNIFASFTMLSSNKNSIADYIVTPSEVIWQDNEQFAKTGLEFTYNLANENWSTSISNSNFYVNRYPSNYYNWANKTNSSNWNNDYLWLPSLSETGINNSKTGLWELSNNQRSNTTNSWVRSGKDNTANEAYVLNASGEDYNYSIVNSACGVRPAMHINLNLAYASAIETERDLSNYVKVNELWNDETQKMSDANLNTLMKYLTGNDKISYSDVLNMAKQTKNANDFRSIKANGKNSGQDILLTLGGLDWTTTYLSTDKNGNVILTLWLASDYQQAWQNVSYKDGFNSSLTNGIMRTRYSSWVLGGETVTQYPDTMYGTSYVRAVTLNNGGTYSVNTSSATYAKQNSQSVFANFTMPVKGRYNDITDFLVSPVSLSWQENQSFKTFYGQGNDYSNEAWLYNYPNTNFVENTNYGNIIGNDIWKNDYLWLPSYTEIASIEDKSFWGLSSNQLHTFSDEFYLRSYSNVTSNVYSYNYALKQVTSSGVGSISSVRPAMHLNITAILESLTNAEQADNSVIYLDTINGNDYNNGTSFLSPVKTIECAERLVTNNGTVFVMNKITVLQNTTFGKNKFYTLKRWEGAEYLSGYWGTLIQVGSYESESNKTFANLYINVVINGNGLLSYGSLESGNTNTANAAFAGIDVTYGNLILDNNSGLENFNNKFYTHIIYLRHEDSNLTINFGKFYARDNACSSIIFAENINSKIIINSGTFENNTLFVLTNEELNSLIYGGNITIKNAKFINNTFDNNVDNTNLFAGIIKLYAGGQLIIEDSLFNNNISSLGGVINLGEDGSLTIKNSEFINNIAEAGGVIYLNGNNNVTILDSMFNNNIANVGGVIFGFANNKINITGSNFENNKVTASFVINEVEYAGGGAILLNGNENKLIINSTNFYNNSANVLDSQNDELELNGGAIFVSGAKLFIKISNSNFNLNNAKTNGGSIFVLDTTNSNSNVEITKCNFEKCSASVSGGAVYVLNVLANINNCYFKENFVTSEENGAGGALFGGTSYNNTFEGNMSANYGGATYNVDNYNSSFIANTAKLGGAVYGGASNSGTFVNNYALYAGGAIYNPSLIFGCIFNGNSAGNIDDENSGLGGAVYWTDNLTQIQNSTFTNNSATKFGGAIFVNIDNEELVNLTIIDSEFTYNFANTGSAIYVSGKIAFSLKGKIKVTNNVSSSFGAIYFAGNNNSLGGSLSFGDTAKVNNIYIFNNFVAESIESLEKNASGNILGETASNLYVDFDNGGNVDIKLASNLIGGSKIGIVTNNFVNASRLKQGTENDYLILNYLTSTDILTTATNNAFVSDDLSNAVFYSTTTYNGNTKTGLNIYVKVVSGATNTIIYSASDYYGFYDGNEHGVNIQVFAPTENYTIYYSATENGEYTTTPITVRDAGQSKTVWFYITANGFTTTNKECRNIAIDKMNIYYDDADINVNLWFNLTIQTKQNGGTNINRFISSTVIDEDGNAVSCDFIIYAPSVTTVGLTNTNNNYKLDIIPKNTEKYKTILGLTIFPTVEYEKIIFSNGYFYPNEEELQLGEESAFKLNANNFNFANIVKFVANNGKVMFNTTYTVQDVERVTINNVMQVSRYNFYGAIFNISTNGKLIINTSLDAKLTFVGECNTSVVASSMAAITNSGTLEVIGNVTFTDFWNTNPSTNGGAINSNGTLNLEGVTISNNRSSLGGGGVYATGTTTIIDCLIYNNRAVSGGGLYLSGNATLNNVRVYQNLGATTSTADTTDVFGAGIYITGEESIVNIIDSQITHNSFVFATNKTSGGGLYIIGANVTLTNTDVSFNTNARYGGGIYAYTNATVTGNNLRVESNILHGATNCFGGGIFTTHATFNFVSGVIRSNGVEGSINSSQGLGVYVGNGTFNFASVGDTTSQITLNTNTNITANVSGLGLNSSPDSVINIYGGNISQNYGASNVDGNAFRGEVNIGGTALITGNNYFFPTAMLYVLDNWEGMRYPEYQSYFFRMYLEGDRTNTVNPVVVKAKDSFIPTWDEWNNIYNKIFTGVSNSSDIISGSVKTISHDAILNEYTIFYKAPQAAGTGVYYFNPSGGNDLNAGTAVGTALKTWNGVLQKSKPGDTIILNSTWVISDFIDIDGEGRVLKRYLSFTGHLIQISGSYKPVVNIKNIILDGNKRKTNGNSNTGSVTEHDWNNYLSSGCIILASVSCTLNLKNVVVRNNYNTSYGAIYLYNSVTEASFSAIDCQFLDNLSGNGNCGAVFTVAYSNTDFKFYLFNCTFSGNERVYTSYWYNIPTCVYFAGSSNSGKTQDIDIINCKFNNNSVFYNSASTNYDGYGKTMCFEMGSYSNTEKIDINIDNCEFDNNKNKSYINNSKPSGSIIHRTGDIVVITTGTAINFNFTNIKYTNNFNFYLGLALELSTSFESKVNIKNCNFENNEYFTYMVFIQGKATTVIDNCLFSGQTSSTTLQHSGNAYETDLTISNCKFYNTCGLYAGSNRNNVTISNIIMRNGNADYVAINCSTAKGKIIVRDVDIDGASSGIFLAKSQENIVENAIIKNCRYGIYASITSGISILNNVNIQNASTAGIYSVLSYNQRNTIIAKNVYIDSIVNHGLKLDYTDFYGENVNITNSNIGVYCLGSTVKNVDISNGNYGMQVYSNSYIGNTIENVTINNMGAMGVQQAPYGTPQCHLDVFINLKISNCYNHAFYDNTRHYSHNSVFENCVFENSYYGYYNSYQTTASYNNTDTITFNNCTFKNNRYYGAFCQAYYGSNNSIQTTYNFNNCVFEYNSAGLYLYWDNYGVQPKFNINANSVSQNNGIGMYIATSSNNYILTGGKYINNYLYGVYAPNAYLYIEPAVEGGVVIKDNGYGYSNTSKEEFNLSEIDYYKPVSTPVATGNNLKIYKDLYASRYYLKGSFDIESLFCSTDTYGIYITGSIAGAKPVEVGLVYTQTAGAVVAQGSNYTPTAEDYAKLLETNWTFEINASNELVLKAVKQTAPIQGENIYYFDPSRTINGSGKIPTDPITSWDNLKDKLNPEVTVYMMAPYTVSSNMDCKNATFKIYVDTTKNNASYYFQASMFKVVTGSFTLSNIKIDGNSNYNGFSSGAHYTIINGGYTNIPRFSVEGAIAHVSGNATFTINNMYATNMYCNNAIRVASGSNKLNINNCVFENVYAYTTALIYSQGNQVSADNCRFININTYAIYCDYENAVNLSVFNCKFIDSATAVYFNGNYLQADNCYFERVNICFYIYNATNSSSYIQNCYAEKINSYFAYVYAYSRASYVKFTNIEIISAQYGVYLENSTYWKYITGTNVIIKNVRYGFSHYSYANINISNYQAINCYYGFGYQTANVGNVTITLTNSKFVNNFYGVYFRFYANYSGYTLNLTNTTFENCINYAIYCCHGGNSNSSPVVNANFTDVSITNCGGGIYVSTTSLRMTRCKINGITSSYAIYYDARHNIAVDMRYCDIMNVTSQHQAIYVTNYYRSSASGDFYIYYSKFSNNRCGSLYTNSNQRINFYIYDSIFDESSGSPTRGADYCSIRLYDSYSYLYLYNKIIVEGGIYTYSGNSYFRLGGNLSEGSYVRLCLGGNNISPGNYSYYVFYSGGNTTYMTNSAKYFHLDGYKLAPSGYGLYVVNVDNYLPRPGEVNPENYGAVYFNPASGNDLYSGRDPRYPVKTWQRVEEVNVHDLPVYLMDQWNITTDTVIDGHGWTLLRYYDKTLNANYTGTMFYIQKDIDVTIKNLTIHGNRYSYSNGNLTINGPVLTSTGYAFYNYGSLLLQNCEITYFNTEHHIIYNYGNFIARDCNFMYNLFNGNNLSVIYTGTTRGGVYGDEVSFYGCYFGSNGINNGTVNTIKWIHTDAPNMTTNIYNCEFNTLRGYTEGSASICITGLNNKLNVVNLREINNLSYHAKQWVILVDSESCDVYIDDCEFIDPYTVIAEVYATSISKAIYISTNGKIKITNCSFENFKAEKGSGIYIVNKPFVASEDNTETGGEEGGEPSEVIAPEPNIILNNLEFKDCFNSDGDNFGGAIYIDTTALTGGAINLSNISCYYVHRCYDAIYVAGNSANININKVLIDGSNYTQENIINNSSGIYVTGVNNNIVNVNDVIIKNCIENESNRPMFSVTFEGENESKTTVTNLQIINNKSIGDIVTISGTNLKFFNNTFTGNRAINIVNLVNNFNNKVYDLTFNNNIGGASIAGQIIDGSNNQISNINILNNINTSGFNIQGTEVNGNSEYNLFINNVTLVNNINMPFGGYFKNVAISIKNSNITNNLLSEGNFVFVNSLVNLEHTIFSYNTLQNSGEEILTSAFISRGADMFVKVEDDNIYASGGVSVIGGKVKLNYVEISNNFANSYGGGAVFASGVTIQNSNILNNASGTFGGGLVITMDADIKDSNIAGNTAGSNGGGIWFGANLMLRNVNLSNNTSVQNGSAIYSYGRLSNLDIKNCVIKQNTSYGDGGIYYVNAEGSVEINDIQFIGNTGYGKGAALYLNSLTFVESNLVFSGNNIYGTLINFENVSNFEMSDFVVSGNYGFGENATLFSFTSSQGSSARMLFSDGRIYGNKMEYNASVVIDDGLYIRMSNVEVTGNSNLYTGSDLTTDNGKGGAIFVKNGTLILQDGLAFDNWAEFGAWLYVGPKGKAIISSQELSNIATDAETTINGVIYVESGGELELHNCKVLGISLSTLKGAINNNGHTKIINSYIYDNATTNSIIYNGKTGVISFEEVDIYNNTSTNGGAIYNLGVINFVSGKIRDNSATQGGAIYNEGDIALSGGEIINNTASKGGAIYNLGTIILSSGSIKQNYASNSGAGVYNAQDASLLMNGGEITLNTKTEDGEAIIGSGVANFGSLYLYGGSISNNGSQETGNGGGLYAGANSQNIISGGVISNNLASAVANGANIYLSANSYTSIKNAVINSGRETHNNKLADIYLTSATIVIDNVEFISSAEAISLRADDSDVTLINSNITNLTPSLDSASFYFAGGNVTIKNTTFTQTAINKDNLDNPFASSGVVYLDNVITLNIEKCNFVENFTRALYFDVSKNESVVTINNTTFAGNSVTGNGGAILVAGGTNKVNANILIKNSTFISNVASGNGGAIYLGTANGAVVELYNTYFGGFIDSNNNGVYDGFDSTQSNFAVNGGAIYVESSLSASLILKGEVSITYNGAQDLGAGIYFAYNGEIDYDNNIYGLSIQSGALVTIKNNYKNSSKTSLSITTKDRSNLHLTQDSNRGILVAELSSGSDIGISTDKVENNMVLVKTYKEDIPLTTADLNAFSCDDYNYRLTLNATENALISVRNSADDNATLVVKVSDKVYTMDGTPKTITREDFTVYNCSSYTIYYAETEDGEYLEVAPTFVQIKDYTIYYKVVDNTDLNRFVTGGLTFRITGRILSIEEAPKAYVNANDKLGNARFEGGVVKSGNAIVSGTWAFNNPNTVPTNINARYSLIFTPSDPTLYENTVTILVSPTIAFNKVYFFENKFYTDLEHTKDTGITSLSTMVSCLDDGGEIFFLSTYIAGNNGILEETITTHKKIFMGRHTSFTNAPMISLPINANTIRLILGGGSGSIFIIGGGAFSSVGTEPLFSNNGVLTLTSNVYISNISNTDGGPAVINNLETGVLNLSCEIQNTYSDANIVLLTGGSIYNEGTMVINGGYYRLNYSNYGNGGFIYNTGSLTINSGLFARNYALRNGGCIYTKGGSVVLNGGQFIGNSADYGGAICVDEEANVIINGAEFYSNTALRNGGSIYTISGKVVQNSGNFKFNVNLYGKQYGNNKNLVEQENLKIYIIVISIALGAMLILVLLGLNKYKHIFKNKNLK